VAVASLAGCLVAAWFASARLPQGVAARTAGPGSGAATRTGSEPSIEMAEVRSAVPETIGPTRSELEIAPLVQVWSLADEGPAEGALLSLNGLRIESEDEDHSLFRLPSLEKQDTLEVEAAGLFPVTLSGNEALALEVFDGVRRIGLRAIGGVVVHVSDSDRRDVAGAFVEVYPLDARAGGVPGVLPRPWPIFARDGFDSGPPNRFVVPGATGADGCCRIPELPCGQRLLVTAKRGTAVVREELTIDPSLRSRRVEVELASSTRIRGTLQWSDGTPASAVLVRLSSCDPADTDSLHHPSDAQGRFEFRDVPRGCVLWHPQVPGAQARALEVLQSEHDLGTLVLPKSRVFAGRVVAASLPVHVSLAGLIVVATSAGIELDRGRTDRNGRFEIRSPFDDVALRVEALGRGRMPHDFAGQLASPLEVNVDGACGSVRFEVRPGKGLDAVDFHPHQPRPAIRIIAEPEGTAVEMHPEGGYTLHLIPAGDYGLRITRADGSSAWLPQIRVTRQETVLAAGIVFGLGDIAGRTVDPQGAPLSNVRVSLVEEGRSGSGRPRRAVSDTLGRFAFDDVAPGGWRITSTATEVLREGGQVVCVDPAATATVELVLGGVGMLAGRVSSTRLASPPTLRLLPGGWGWFAEPLSILEPAPGGEFGPIALAEGRYVLGTSFREPGDRLVEHWRDVIVRPGETSSVHFEIPASIELEFKRDGETIEGISDGYAYFPGGQVTIVRGQSYASLPTADLPTGPWILAVRTIESRDPKAVTLMRGFYVARVADRAVTGGRLEVQLDHAALRVCAGGRLDVSERMNCELVGVLGDEELMPHGARVRIGGRVGETGDALFENLPRGARLRLRGPDGSGGTATLDVELTSEELVVDWPPRAR